MVTDAQERLENKAYAAATSCARVRARFSCPTSARRSRLTFAMRLLPSCSIIDHKVRMTKSFFIDRMTEDVRSVGSEMAGERSKTPAGKAVREGRRPAALRGARDAHSPGRVTQQGR